jgi:hypothetical protein
VVASRIGRIAQQPHRNYMSIVAHRTRARRTKCERKKFVDR